MMALEFVFISSFNLTFVFCEVSFVELADNNHINTFLNLRIL